MEAKTIKLHCHGIVVEFNEKDCATIQSNLLETCPICDNPKCDGDCEDFERHIMRPSDSDDSCSQGMYEKRQDQFKFMAYRHAIHGIEAMILALAVEGYDIQSNYFLSAIETAIDAVGNNID